MKPQWPVISGNWKYLTSIGRLDIHRYPIHECWFVVVWGEVKTYADGAILGSDNPFCGIGWQGGKELQIGARDKWVRLTDEERAAVMALVKMERSLA